MGSLVTETSKKKAMWLYPKVLGFNPSQRWGHTACFSGGLMYIFGGCCGGLHFSDVLCLDIEKMEWSKVITTGEKPGARDSHTANMVGQKMIVFGGTNGFKKVNDIHILDLFTKEWFSPKCEGTPPSPRESHTATLVGCERLVIFGGSGEGDANYLNDLHILDLRNMRWSSPEVKGDLPVPRDSHCSLAIGNKVIVYGGDSGDQYHGDVNLLDIQTMTWSKLKSQGSSPGVRAGHAAVNIGTKVYIIGGVGDKRYCNDIWVFDISNCLWSQLDTHGQQPQGRFSHTAIVAETGIVIYGGCGEDERPLNELLVLQLRGEYPNVRNSNISGCKVFGTYWNQEKKIPPPYLIDSGNSQQKRRRIAATAKVWDVESEQEEHSLSLSQHSSPSQSDQEQTPTQKPNPSIMDSQRFNRFKMINKVPSTCQYDNFSSNKRVLKNYAQISQQGHRVYVDEDRKETRHQAIEQKHVEPGHTKHIIGAEVRGKVDGAFDSGLLMTASVNGRIFRGVLFAPGAGVPEQNCSFSNQTLMNSNHVEILKDSSKQVTTCSRSSEPFCGLRQPLMAAAGPSPMMRGSSATLPAEHKIRSDLQGLVLTLGGPTSGN